MCWNIEVSIASAVIGWITCLILLWRQRSERDTFYARYLLTFTFTQVADAHVLKFETHFISRTTDFAIAFVLALWSSRLFHHTHRPSDVLNPLFQLNVKGADQLRVIVYAGLHGGLLTPGTCGR
jgi:hypothetical protein